MRARWPRRRCSSTSWAFTVLRRCNSSDGRAIRRLIVQGPGQLRRCPGRPDCSKSSASRPARARSASRLLWNEAPNQAFFGVFQLPERGQLPGRHARSSGGPPPCEFPPGRPLPSPAPCGRSGPRTGRGPPHPGSWPPPSASCRETAAGSRPARSRAPRPPDRAGTPDTAASCAVFHGTASAPFRRMNVSGSSPLSSTTTLTSKPFGDQQLARPDRPRPGRPRRDRS